MSNVKRVAVTGAAGQIGYSLLPLIANGGIFGPNVKVQLQLLEVTPVLNALNGVRMELAEVELAVSEAPGPATAPAASPSMQQRARQQHLWEALSQQDRLQAGIAWRIQAGASLLVAWQQERVSWSSSRVLLSGLQGCHQRTLAVSRGWLALRAVSGLAAAWAAAASTVAAAAAALAAAVAAVATLLWPQRNKATPWVQRVLLACCQQGSSSRLTQVVLQRRAGARAAHSAAAAAAVGVTWLTVASPSRQP